MWIARTPSPHTHTHTHYTHPHPTHLQLHTSLIPTLYTSTDTVFIWPLKARLITLLLLQLLTPYTPPTTAERKVKQGERLIEHTIVQLNSEIRTPG